MKFLKIVLIALLMLPCACHKDNRIDDVFRWSSSGVPEADTVWLSIERHFSNLYNRPLSKETGRKLIADFCSIADAHPHNRRLHLRKEYLRISQLQYMDKSRFMILMDSIMPQIDSLKYPEEFHCFKSLRLEGNYDIVDRYNWCLDNIEYYKNANDSIELSRNLNYAGNIMLDLRDTVKALQYFNKSLEICWKMDFRQGIGANLINTAILSPPDTKDSIFNRLLKDTLLIPHHNVRAAITHNAFLSNDSIELLMEAAEIYNHNNISHSNYSLVMGLVGDWYVRHGEPEKGLGMILQALDTARKYTPDSGRHFSCLYEYLAYAYFESGEKDSCITSFARLNGYQRLYNSQITQGEVYAKDAAMRIRMAEENVRHQKQKQISLLMIVLLILSLLILWLWFGIRRRRIEKQHNEEMMRERNERNLQSIRAQSKVMEESDQLVDSIAHKIKELENSARIPEESAKSLTKILQIHKSNEENRRGFLKVQKELDTRFIDNLTKDFPTLSETQIKLASLIAAGLDKRQIGNILNIEPSSVIKSRYRLRARLHLTKEASLEEFLRRYTREI